MAYASPDRARARVLHRALSGAGVEVFLDEAVLRPGDNWQRLLPEHLRASAVVVALVSSSTPDAHYENDEVVVAVGQVRREGAPADPRLYTLAPSYPMAPLACRPWTTSTTRPRPGWWRPSSMWRATPPVWPR